MFSTALQKTVQFSVKSLVNFKWFEIQDKKRACGRKLSAVAY